RSIAFTFVSTAALASTALAGVLISVPAQAGTGRVSIAPASTAPASTARLAGAAGRQGVITGLVDGAAGRPLVGLCVAATGPGGTAATVTKADGRYVLAGLRPGGYTLHYSACAADGRYVDQWSGGASWPARAAIVGVAAGQVRQVG